jgi:type II secretory pathway pseudopilin PulG
LTLVEVLVAAVLLGVGVVGLISVASLSLRNQQRTEQRAAALCLAQEQLAQVELVGPRLWLLGHPTQGSQAGGGIAYDWTIGIESLAVGELYSVDVQVHWSSPGGGGSVELETWLNDYQSVARPTSGQPGSTPPGAPGGE